MSNVQIRPLLTLLTLSLLVSLTSCDDSPAQADTANRAVLVYMLANNDLADYAESDLAEMKRAAGDIGNGRLLIYLQSKTDVPRLFEISSSSTDLTLKTYDTTVSSADPRRLKEVVDDVRSIADADSYGIIFWSHSTGWQSETQSTLANRTSITPLSFGYDEGSSAGRMKITSMAKALEGNRFDFIYFDCCHMATVEVAYELRHLTPFIAASPTELGVDGMPYDLNLRCFFAPKANLSQAIRNTFSTYPLTYTYGCSISLISTEGLDRLASVSRMAMKYAPLLSYTPVRYFRKGVLDTGIFDMAHYFRAMTEDDPPLSREWEVAFRNTVTESHSTSSVFMLPADNFNGLGCHILSDSYPSSALGYDELAWYRDVVAP